MPPTPESAPSLHAPQLRRTTKACDACKLRKVKCNGQDRCQQCNHLNLQCVYSAPKPRLKSARRGQLIAKYKQATQALNGGKMHDQTTKHGKTESISPPLQQTPTLPAIATLLPESPSTPLEVTPSRDPAFFSKFLSSYEVSVYPVNPIITVAEIQSSINEMHMNHEARAFVYAYVAVTMNLTGYATGSPADVTAQVEYWCNQAAMTRGSLLPSSKADVRKIMTSQFLHICLMGLSNRDMAFYYLRESITMIQMLRVDHPEVMRLLNLQERARRQRLYFEAFVHERYLAILDYRPVVLLPLPFFPENDPSLPPGIHPGFLQIIKLFTLIDHDFVGHWLGSRTGNTSVTAEWVEDKQRQIDNEHAGDDDEVSHLTDMQQADLVITKHWLRTLVWQMAMSNCLLSSAASKESMSLLFPVRLSKQLRTLVGKMSRRSIEIHGSGIQQKLFELTDTIANVIITVPAATIEEITGRIDDFIFLCNFFFAFPRFEPVERDILQKKLETLQSLFPYSADTPDSKLSTSALEDGGIEGNDSRLERESTQIRAYHADYHNPVIQESPINDPPARMWHDMTRRLSMASSSMHSAYAGGHGSRLP